MSTAEGQDRISVGHIIKETLASLGRNRLLFGALGLLLGFLPTFVFGLLRVAGVVEVSDDPLDAMRGSTGENVATTIAGLFLQAALIQVVLADAAGRSTGFNQSLTSASAHWLPLLGVTIVAGLGILLGTLLLVVPGFLLYLRWLVAAPVRVAERKSVFESLGRSAVLVRDNYWRLTALTLATVLIIGAGVLGMSALLVVIPEHALLASIMSELVFAPLIVMAIGVLTGVGAAVTYVELRRVKGSPVTDIAAVFD